MCSSNSMKKNWRTDKTAMMEGVQRKVQKLGYDVKLLYGDDGKYEKYKCPLCKFLIREPIQTERGELACMDCYNTAKSNRSDDKCPIDLEPCTEEVFRDKGKEKEILQLNCFCPFVTHGCSWKDEVRHLKIHQEKCAFKPINCQLCKEEMIQINLCSHLNKCPKLVGNGCPFKGCIHDFVSIEELKKHLHENTITHAYIHSAAITELQDQLRIRILEHNKISNEMEVMRSQIAEIYETIKKGTTAENRDKDKKKMLNLEERIAKVEKEDEQVIRAESMKNDGNMENQEKIRQLSNEVVQLNKNFADLDLRQQLFEHTNYNGKLLWKIDHINSRIQKAVTGRVTTLHSAPVFTIKFGYKFCARIYLNGDGIGKCTHVSLFFVLMKSEFDNLLAWPFCKVIKFKLINQKGRRPNIEESFVADRNSSSFKRPEKDMNIASGCPKFVAIDTFKDGGFIDNDCVIIEMEV